ncbi:MAG: hypothetical protein HOE90_04025 [Bacteriovoracaceae bacterium]|nr:hypothetical protein [Bacteriovoracaceae bacterium]
MKNLMVSLSLLIFANATFAGQTLEDRMSLVEHKLKTKLYLETDDFSFHPHTYLQFYYYNEKVVTGASETSDKYYNFRRAVFYFDGFFARPLYTYKLEYDVSSNSLEEYNLNFAPLSWLQFRLGKQKVPFGMQRMISSKKYQFTDRSIVENEFTHSNELGVSLWGNFILEGLTYHIGSYKSVGTHFQNVVSIFWAPLGPFKWEESDRDDNTDIRLNFGLHAHRQKSIYSKKYINSYGASSSFKLMGWSYNGAIYIRDHEYGDGVATLDGIGHNIQVGKMVVPRLWELAFKFAEIKLDGDNNDTHEWGLVSNYFLEGQNLKFTTEYTAKTTIADPKRGLSRIHNNIVKAQIQLYF